MDYKVDAENAAFYESGMVPAVFRPWARELIRLAGPVPGERVLDLACGTGVVAREVAALMGDDVALSGCDLNPAMIDAARTVAVREGHHIDFHEGDAGALPFEDGAFDLVLCQQGFQFFPDRAAALAEINRVLAPGGRFAVAIWLSEESCVGHFALIQALEKNGIDTAVERRPFNFGDEAQMRAVFGYGGFQSLEISAARIASRFNSPEHCIEVLTKGAPSMRLSIQQTGPEAQRAIVKDAVETMTPYMTSAGLEMPMESHLLLARV